jgi:hypothetical protein
VYSTAGSGGIGAPHDDEIEWQLEDHRPGDGANQRTAKGRPHATLLRQGEDGEERNRRESKREWRDVVRRANVLGVLLNERGPVGARRDQEGENGQDKHPDDQSAQRPSGAFERQWPPHARPQEGQRASNHQQHQRQNDGAAPAKGSPGSVPVHGDPHRGGRLTLARISSCCRSVSLSNEVTGRSSELRASKGTGGSVARAR